jgi:hypothetical protein
MNHVTVVVFFVLTTSHVLSTNNTTTDRYKSHMTHHKHKEDYNSHMTHRKHTYILQQIEILMSNYPISTQSCRSLHWRECKDRQLWEEIGIYLGELEVAITSEKYR